MRYYKKSWYGRRNKFSKFKRNRFIRPSRPSPKLRILNSNGCIKYPHSRYGGIPFIEKRIQEAKREVGFTLNRLRKMHKLPWRNKYEKETIRNVWWEGFSQRYYSISKEQT